MAWPFDSLGGVNGVVRNLLREFQSAGRFPPLAVEISSAAASTLPWPLIRMGQLSTWNAQRPWRSILAFIAKSPGMLWRLSALCRRYSIAVLNPHFIGLEYFALLVFRRSGLFRGKLILSFHGSDIREMIQSRGLERRLFRILLLGADWLVACSDGLREEILMFVPERSDRTVVIHNGINADGFLALASVARELPAKFAGRQIIFSVGAYEYKKGHDVLLRAFAKVRATRPNAALVIAGQRSSAELARLASELGIENDVLLLENIAYPEIVSLLKAADLFAFSSRWEKGVCGEGFAMALLEAAAARIPLVTTRTCGADELIENGKTGLIVPTEDADALAEAIARQLNDPEEGLRMAERLYSHVVENFTWKQAYQKYAGLVEG